MDAWTTTDDRHQQPAPIALLIQSGRAKNYIKSTGTCITLYVWTKQASNCITCTLPYYMGVLVENQTLLMLIYNRVSQSAGCIHNVSSITRYMYNFPCFQCLEYLTVENFWLGYPQPVLRLTPIVIKLIHVCSSFNKIFLLKKYKMHYNSTSSSDRLD